MLNSPVTSYSTSTVNTLVNPPSLFTLSPPVHFKLNSSKLFHVETEVDGIRITGTSTSSSPIPSYWLKKERQVEELVHYDEEFLLLRGGKEGIPIIILTKEIDTSSFTISSVGGRDSKGNEWERVVSSTNKNIIDQFHEFQNSNKSKNYVWKNADVLGKDLICHEKNSINIVAYYAKAPWRASNENFRGRLSIAKQYENECDLVVASAMGLEVYGGSRNHIRA